VAIYSDSYYRKQAEELVRECGVQEAPVDTRSIAEHLGIEIVELTMPTWFFGVLMRVEGEPYIVLNRAMPEHRKRFTIGHEVAHYRLHTGEFAYMKNCKRESYHREADIFAAELCMPSYLLRKEAPRWFNDYRYLAKLFGVSETAMVRKLQELGILREGHFDCAT
jgi:Zn-dependent peptidase ImmA (M78 family)